MKRIATWFFLFLYWFLFFLFLKGLFLVVTYPPALPCEEITGIFLHGLIMDISMTAYVMTISSALLFLSVFTGSRFTGKLNHIYTLVILFMVSFITIADLALYPSWRFRIDATVLPYLRHPAEVIASVATGELVILLISVLLLFLVWAVFYRKTLHKSMKAIRPGAWYEACIMLFLSCSLIIPLRGGINPIPVTPGSCFFSNYAYSNQAATNLVWNLGYSVSNAGQLKNPYKTMDPQTARHLTDQLYSSSPQVAPSETARPLPNILLIILESFPYRPDDKVNQPEKITPELAGWMKKGLSFTRFYASGNRSDKGIAALISGFPSLPESSVMIHPEKSAFLPYISRELGRKGYISSFYYGGDVDFMSLRSFLVNGGFRQIISKDDIPADAATTKWGIHDHVLFRRLYQDLSVKEHPSFTVVFTLSSHEPFSVPFSSGGDMNTTAGKYRNSLAYTDSCLGDFLRKASAADWWKNTLVILTADHSSAYLDDPSGYHEESFRIPMVFTGGAVSQEKKGTVNTFGSQTDFAATLFAWLGIIPEQSFPFSRNMLDTTQPSFAYYNFTPGFGWCTDSCALFYNFSLGRINTLRGNCGPGIVTTGKAYLQESYERFLNLNSKSKTGMQVRQ